MNFMARMLAVILLVTLGTTSSLFAGSFTYKGTVTPGSWIKNIQVPYEADKAAHNAMAQIYLPKGYVNGDEKRTLIVLHGYGQNMKSWEQNSDIEGFANKYGFALVCPDMGKTLYETSYYPETTVKWAPLPGGKFVAEALIKFLRDNFNLANVREKTGILGLSTGARGAVILAAKYPDRFGAAAGLSGDYDPTIMTNDRLLISIYGPHDKFEDRWEKDASVLYHAEGLKNTPVYLSHGSKDMVVSSEQSMIMAIRLKQLQKDFGGYPIVFKEKKGKLHDWGFWAYSLSEMMGFFDEKLAK